MTGDEEVVRFFDCESLVCLCEFKAHENRYFFCQSLCVCMQRISIGVIYTVSESRV